MVVPLAVASRLEGADATVVAEVSAEWPLSPRAIDRGHEVVIRRTGRQTCIAEARCRDTRLVRRRSLTTCGRTAVDVVSDRFARRGPSQVLSSTARRRHQVGGHGRHRRRRALGGVGAFTRTIDCGHEVVIRRARGQSSVAEARCRDSCLVRRRFPRHRTDRPDRCYNWSLPPRRTKSGQWSSRSPSPSDSRARLAPGKLQEYVHFWMS